MKVFTFFILSLFSSPYVYLVILAGDAGKPRNHSSNLETKTSLSNHLSQHYSRIIYLMSLKEKITKPEESSKPSSLSIITSSLNTNLRIKTSTHRAKVTYLKMPPIPEIGDTFKVIREQNKLFVDKTQFISKLYGRNRMLYLTRPRRFGKSIFIQMLKEYFAGRKEYFIDTAIYSRGNKMMADGKWIEQPVIHVDFSQIAPTQDKNFAHALDSHLLTITASYGLRKEEFTNIGWLISQLNSRYRKPVYILIDESDFPFAQCKTSTECEEIKTILVKFYSSIKASYDFIGIMFVTGVLRLSVKEIGSGWNAYTDLTFEEDFSTLMGFTEQEIKTYFNGHIKKFAAKEHSTYAQIIQRAEEWYDGYSFTINATKVLNPLSMCTSFQKQLFYSYWANSGSLNIIIDEITRRNLELIYFSGYSVTLEDLMLTDLESPSISLATRIYHYGYLTIKKAYGSKDSTYVTLDFPNKEVIKALKNWLPENYDLLWQNDKSRLPKDRNQLKGALMEEDIYEFISCLNSFCFKSYGPPLDQDELKERESTRSIINVLAALDIECRDGQQIRGLKRNVNGTVSYKTIGDIDLMITSVKPKYIIEIKEGAPGAVTAILQLISYIMEDENAFKRMMEPDVCARLLGIGIKYLKKEKRSLIQEWIWVPYTHGKILLSEIRASDVIEFRNEIMKRLRQKSFDFETSKIVW